MRRGSLLAGAAVLAVLAVLAIGLWARLELAGRAPVSGGDDGRVEAGAPAPRPAVVGAGGLPDPPREAGAGAEPDARPRSLRGTEVDGALPVDAAGHLVPGPDVLRLFDYFLSARGEESEAAIETRILRHVRATLEPPAREEAEALLGRYLDYHARMRRLAGEGPVPEDAERRLQWIREERRAAFGRELAEALFGESEALARLDLERRRVLLDPELGEEERARRLEAIDARMPEALRARREEDEAPLRVQAQARALRRAGASEAEVFALRARAFGPEAAERLAALDREQAAWRARLEEYTALRDALLADESLDAETKDARLDALRRQRFEPEEQARVRALDAASGRKGPAAPPSSAEPGSGAPDQNS